VVKLPRKLKQPARRQKQRGEQAQTEEAPAQRKQNPTPSFEAWMIAWDYKIDFFQREYQTRWNREDLYQQLIAGWSQLPDEKRIGKDFHEYTEWTIHSEGRANLAKQEQGNAQKGGEARPVGMLNRKATARIAANNAGSQGSQS
jgi:hypothetical protein